MECPKRALLWSCISLILLPNVINEPLGSWTAGMRPGSLVGEIKNILATELKNRIVGGIMTTMGGGHMNPAGTGHGGGTSMGTSIMSSLLGGGQTHGGQGSLGYGGGMMGGMGGRFQDYLNGGLRMHATIAIDFSSWNGHQSQPNSLHYFNPQGMLNNYEEAIGSVLGTIEAYDWDNRFQVYGFAAQYPAQNMISHAFNLNQNNAECEGVQGVLNAYRNCLNNIQFSRPVYFSQIISNVVQSIRPMDQDNYYLLIILTAGQIEMEDMMVTENVIAQGSTLPLSIMIVGIGNGPFQNMVRLDNDVRSTMKLHRKEKKKQSGYYNSQQYMAKPKKDKKNKHNKMGMMDPSYGSGMGGPNAMYGSGTGGGLGTGSTLGTMGALGAVAGLAGLGSGGTGGGMGGMGGMGGTGGGMGALGALGLRRKHRDIVQFVPFNMFRNFGADNVARVQFAQELIAELPFQVESYMRSYNYMPKPPDPNRPPRGGLTPGAMPGSMPGAMPGTMPGAMPGAMPGTMPGNMTSAYGQGNMPGAYGAGQTPVGGNFQSPTNPSSFYSATSYLTPQMQSSYQNLNQQGVYSSQQQFGTAIGTATGAAGGALSQYALPNTGYNTNTQG